MESGIETQGRQGFHFTNWATTYSCSPELYFEPTTEQEVKQILAAARKEGKRVKVVGCGHSPSDLACTDDYMLSLTRLNHTITVDQDKLQVTVPGGCRLDVLNNDVLPRHGMAFSVQGSVSELTAAGVIATAVHGTGIRYGVMSSYVAGMRVMLASGEIIQVSKEENADLFPAMAVNLGCLGIVLSVTFQCEKAYRLRQCQYPNHLEDVIENLDTYIKASDHFRFMWYPHTESVVCYHASRTMEKAKSEGSWFWDMFVGFHLLQFFLYISTFLPKMVSTLNAVFFRLLNTCKSEKVDRSDRIFNFNCLFKQYVMEWSVPREKTGVVLYELKEWIETTGFPAHFPIEVRFVKGDELYLSPCYQQESCYINIIMYRPYNKLVSFEPYWARYQDIVTKHGGRPHWAKDHKITGEEFAKIYPKWQEFSKIRQKLDPTGMFLNDHLESIFGKPATNHKSNHAN